MRRGIIDGVHQMQKKRPIYTSKRPPTHPPFSVSEWELQERREQEEEREKEAEALGAEDEVDSGEEPPLFLPTPSFIAPAEEE